MQQTSDHYEERALNLIERANGAPEEYANYLLAQAQVNATLALAAETQALRFATEHNRPLRV